MTKLILDVGVSSSGKFKRSVFDYNKNRSLRTKEYALWRNVLERCYSTKSLSTHPTYTGCSVSENFKNFQWFAEWCNNQIGFREVNFNLDKDLLVKGNKHYSEDTCVFLPRELNVLLTKRQNDRGDYPIGVYFFQKAGKFTSSVAIGGGLSRYLGIFSSEQEAFQAYKTAKEGFVKEQAELWKDKIDPRAYEALLNYTVEITD